jgi:hypothetical protein
MMHGIIQLQPDCVSARLLPTEGVIDLHLEYLYSPDRN